MDGGFCFCGWRCLWIAIKMFTHWSSKKFEDIILEDMGIPLNQEMLKQAKVHEGNTEFFYKLHFMTRGYVFEHAEKKVENFPLNPKGINFLTRMLLQFYQVPLLALQHACMSGMVANASSKQIEAKIKQIVEQNGRDTEEARKTKEGPGSASSSTEG